LQKRVYFFMNRCKLLFYMNLFFLWWIKYSSNCFSAWLFIFRNLTLWRIATMSTHAMFIPACFFVGIMLALNLYVMRVLTDIKV